MTPVMLWLLISLPGHPHVNSNVPTVTVARFADVEECQRVLRIISDGGSRQPLKCVQARVVP